jgi:uncharacterized repeat protein (TIGR03847 family)
MGTKERYEYPEATLLAPFAVGAPGNRTFFLGIGDADEWVRIWVEKEHLLGMVEGIDKFSLLLTQLQISFSDVAEAPPSPYDTPSGLPVAELDIVQLMLGYDEQGKATIDVVVQPSGAQEPEPAEVYCQVTLGQLKKLRHRTEKIIAAGRPLCPICGGPIDPTGHICPEEN